jgi:hypothetical protein
MTPTRQELLTVLLVIGMIAVLFTLADIKRTVHSVEQAVRSVE